MSLYYAYLKSLNKNKKFNIKEVKRVVECKHNSGRIGSNSQSVDLSLYSIKQYKRIN